MRATLITGGNIGNREAYLQFALYHIEKSIGTPLQTSQIYESEAWGDKAKGPFLNQVLVVETALTPLALLEAIQHIEHMAGRIRFEKWGDRTLDIDILFFEDQVIDEMALRVPHPFIRNRKFTLVPLAELMPDFIHPVLKETISNLLKSCTDSLAVKPFQA